MQSSFFTFLGGDALGLPVSVWVLIAHRDRAHRAAAPDPFGYRVRSIGSNPEAATFSGISIPRVRVQALVLMGLLAGSPGCMGLAFFQSGDPNVGTGFELQAIAAAIIGGTPLRGGSATVVGAMFGAILLGVVNSGLVYFNVPINWSAFATGAVILAAVSLDSLLRRRRRGQGVGARVVTVPLVVFGGECCMTSVRSFAARRRARRCWRSPPRGCGVAACGGGASSGASAPSGGKKAAKDVTLAMITATTTQNAFQEMAFGAKAAAGAEGIKLNERRAERDQRPAGGPALPGRDADLQGRHRDDDDDARPLRPPVLAGRRPRHPAGSVDTPPPPGSNVDDFVGNDNVQVGESSPTRCSRRSPRTRRARSSSATRSPASRCSTSASRASSRSCSRSARTSSSSAR